MSSSMINLNRLVKYNHCKVTNRTISKLTLKKAFSTTKANFNASKSAKKSKQSPIEDQPIPIDKTPTVHVTPPVPEIRPETSIAFAPPPPAILTEKHPTVQQAKTSDLPHASIPNYTASAIPTEDEYDIIIVGGGMVGASLACALGSTPITSTLRVALIDSLPATDYAQLESNKYSSTPDLRVSSINHGSIAYLDAIGAWPYIEAVRTSPFFNMTVWDSAGNGVIQFDHPEGSALGYIVENKLLQASLYERLKSFNNVDVFCPSAISSVSYQPPQLQKYYMANTDNSSSSTGKETVFGEDWVKVHTKDGKVLKAKLVVGADGGKSVIRSTMAVGVTGWSHNQKGVVTVVEHSSPNNTAWQRFLPNGPIALLPLFNNYSSIVWSTTPSHAETLLSLPADEFAQQIDRALSSPSLNSTDSIYSVLSLLKPAASGVNGLLAASSSLLFPSYAANKAAAHDHQHNNNNTNTMDSNNNSNNKQPSILPLIFPNLIPMTPNPPRIERVVGERGAFPLGYAHASEYVKQRFALIGDAAHTINPLAGQGVNLGFADSASLATTLIGGLETGQDVGSLSLLRNYQNQRMPNNMMMMAGVETIKRLFDTSFTPVSVLRNSGLILTNAVSPAKDLIMKYAMGIQSDVSKIGNNARSQ